MTSLGLLLCGVLSLPGAEPGDLGHEVDIRLATPTAGQIHDPYGVYTHLRRPKAPSPYHVVQHDRPVGDAIAQKSPSLRTPPQSPYRLVQWDTVPRTSEFVHKSPTTPPVAVPEPEPVHVVNMMGLESGGRYIRIAEPAPAPQVYSKGGIIACQATVVASSQAGILHADHRDSGTKVRPIQQADLRLLDDDAPPPIIRAGIVVAPTPNIVTAPQELKPAPMPLPEWALQSLPFASALDKQQQGK